MESLTQRDFLSVLEFLCKSYEVCDLQQFRSRVVASLPMLVPSEVTVYNEVDTRQKRVKVVSNPPDALGFPDSIQIFEQHMQEHPLIAHHSRARDPRVLKISDFLSRSRFRDLGLYQEFFRRVGTEFQMVCALRGKEPLLIGIALNRSRYDFTERERLLLALARPHLMQAYKNAATLTRVLGELAALNRGLNKIEGLVISDRDGRTRWIPPGVHRLLGEYFGLKAGNGHLPDPLRQWIKHQSGALSRLEVPRPLVMRSNGTRLTIRMLADHHRILLLLEEKPATEQCAAPRAFGLTARESEILVWAAQGKSNSEIAMILTMRARTVQKHMEHIFQKLGVENRTAAAARFWEAGHRRAREYDDPLADM